MSVTFAAALLPHLVLLCLFLSSHYEFLIRAVTVNFISQFNCTMDCLDIWSDFIVGVSVGVFLDTISILISKADCPP